ncbi:MAG: hypothetical protein QUT30_17030 [Acidobacteriota bacterium]|nr:hypothetical protein [Acidobacteriota bacterium]
MKIKTLLIAVVLVLGLAATASASTQWTVGASPEPVRVATGYTEKVGAISFNTVESANYTVTGTITIDYHYNITVPVDNITITTYCYGTSPCAGAPDLSQKEIEDGSKLVIHVVPNFVDPALDYSFVVDGVRIDVTGLIAGAPYFDINVNATVIASENQITNGQAQALVLQRIMPPFGTLTNETASGASIINGLAPTEVTLTAQENFRNAFWKLDDSTGDPTQTNVQRIYISPTATIATGITITFPDYDATGNWHRVGSGVLSGNGTIVYELVQNTNINAKENFQVTVDVAAQTAIERGSVYPLGTVVFLKIDLGPYPTPANAPSNIPRYLSDPKQFPNTVISFVQDFTKTILMVPYASDQSVFDTGLAVANTTMDPFEDADLNGVLDTTYDDVIDGAIAQTGKIVFYLYPNVGNPFMVSTVALASNPIPGHDTKKVLDATGKLPAGKTYSILLSQLAAAGGYAEDTFEGYMLIVCDFTNAHGQYFVAYEEFNSFSNGAVMLVVSGDYRAGITESLGQ